jgi:hypothetical protein
MTIRRKTRKRGGGQREKLFAWFNYVLDDANKNGWKKFSIIETHTRKNGATVKSAVEMDASTMRSGRHVFPSTDMPMNKKYVTGLAMYLWDPQNNTGTNSDLYRRFESQYRNESRSHSPVRGRNITGLRQHLIEVEEKIDSISSRAISSSPVRQPLPNIGSVRTKKNNQANRARIEELAAKLHSNAEDARELKEFQKKLNEAAIAKWIQQGMTSPHNLNNKLIKQITNNEEVILYTTFLRYGGVTPSSGGNPLYGSSLNISLIVTNRNVYSVRIHLESYKTESQSGHELFSGLHYMPVYTFDQPLNLKQTKMLSILTSNTDYREEDKDESIPRYYNTVSILAGLNKSMGGGRGEMAYIMFPYLEAKKKFESVIRAIPGSYKNGNWRPLDGFFGLYLNETTMEINEFPGIILE